RREAAGVLQLAKVLSPQPEQRRAIEFRVAADVVVGVRMQGMSIGGTPHLLRVVLRLDVDGARTPVVLLARHVAAALEDQDALAGRGEPKRERTAAGARSDDEDVI